MKKTTKLLLTSVLVWSCLSSVPAQQDRKPTNADETKVKVQATIGINNAVEKDPRVQANGKVWRLDKAKISDPSRPRVLLIGDSILNGYLNTVINCLDGKAYVDAWANPYCQGEAYNALLAEVLKNGPYDVIHFNMGLHGFQRDRTVPGKAQKQPRIPDGQFEPLTKAFVEIIKQANPRAKIIWASTTPVTFQDKPSELNPEINAIIIEHNRMAAKVMAEENVPVDDLYSLMIHHLDLKQNDFHWKGAAMKMQGEAVAGMIVAALSAVVPGFAFGNDALRIQDAQIHVTLLLGDSKQAWTWKPALTPAVKSEEHTTPVGKATVEKSIYVHPDGFELAVYRTKLIGRQTETLRCELVNNSCNSVRLREFVMLDGRLDYQGAASNWMVSALTPGYHASGTIQQKLGSRTTFQDDLTVYSDGGQTGVLIAPVRGEADLPCTIQVDQDGKAQVSVVSDMSDIVVAPGETRSSEEVYLSFEPWRQAAQERDRWVAANFGVRTQRESLFGWCSWYAVAGNVTGNDILSMVDFVQKNCSDAPFNMLLIDEGWQVGRHQWEANDKFPGGIKLWTDKIKTAGMMAGIWMCPITPNSRRIVDGQAKEFSFSGEVVRVFPESWYEGYADGKPGKNALDPTNPEVQAYIRKWLTEVRKNGCNFFKLDFTIVADSRNRYNNKLTRFQVQRELFRLYREAIGDDAYLLICSAGQPQRAATGYADAKRIGPDTIAGKGFDGHGTNDLCLLNGIKRMVSTANENGLLFSGDPDVTYVGATGPVAEPQMRSFQTFVGLYGGAAYFGGRLWSKEWTPEKLRWLGMVHPPAKEKAYPFAGGSDVLGEQFGMEVSRPWGSFVDVYLWHGDEFDRSPRRLGMGNVPTAHLGQRFHAYDFWNDKYLGVIGPDYTKLCNQFEGQLLRLTPLGKPGEPTLAGSDLHLTMGAAEIQSLNYRDHGLEVELIAPAGARSGHLTFVSDRPLKLDRATNCEAKLAQVGEKVWSLTLSHRSSEMNQHIRLTDH